MSEEIELKASEEAPGVNGHGVPVGVDLGIADVMRMQRAMWAQAVEKAGEIIDLKDAEKEEQIAAPVAKRPAPALKQKEALHGTDQRGRNSKG